LEAGLFVGADGARVVGDHIQADAVQV
jgi:hypothetical protein